MAIQPKKRSTSKPRGRRARPKPKLDFNTDIKLPTKPNVPPKNLEAYSWFIYGEKGIGKSTLASMFPDVEAFFLWERSRRGLKTKVIPDWDRNEAPLTWSRYKEYLQLLLETTKPGRVVVDTLDVCSKAWEDHWTAEKGVTSLLGINDHGRTWSECMDDWVNTHNDLLYAGWRFTFVSHVRKRPRTVRGLAREELKEAVAEGYVSSETQPSARPWSVGWSKEPVAYAGYYGWHGDERVLQIRGSGTIYAAAENSEDHFLQPKGHEDAGHPYHAIPMGNAKEEAWRNLKAAWNNKLEGYYATDIEDVTELSE